MTDQKRGSPARPDGDRGDEDRCAQCGGPIDVTEWHPVVSEVVDGDLRLYAFCSPDCREEWKDD